MYVCRPPCVCVFVSVCVCPSIRFQRFLAGLHACTQTCVHTFTHMGLMPMEGERYRNTCAYFMLLQLVQYLRSAKADRPSCTEAITSFLGVTVTCFVSTDVSLRVLERHPAFQLPEILSPSVVRMCIQKLAETTVFPRLGRSAVDSSELSSACSLRLRTFIVLGPSRPCST